MRRILFILLLAVLPVQLSWSAAAAYCRHEDGSAANHFGHHEHQHRSAGDAAAKDKKASASTAVETDCASCQLNSAQPIPAPVLANMSLPGTDPPAPHDGASYDSHVPSAPDRPDITALTPAVRFGGVVVTGAMHER